MTAESRTLYRPVGQKELDFVAASGWRAFPPRLPHQPIFYPVLNEQYATMIARKWNARADADGNVGYVLRFQISADVADRYPVQTVGGQICQELWVPAEDLDDFNNAITGPIEVIAVHRAGRLPVKELALMLGPTGDDENVNHALEALASDVRFLGCMRYEPTGSPVFEPPTRPARRESPIYLPCNVEALLPHRSLVLDTDDGDCVISLARDDHYDWFYVNAPPGIAPRDIDQWLFSVAEDLLTGFPFRVGFMIGVGEDGPGGRIVDMAEEYEQDGIPQERWHDYLCPAGGRLEWHPATDDL